MPIAKTNRIVQQLEALKPYLSTAYYEGKVRIDVTATIIEGRHLRVSVEGTGRVSRYYRVSLCHHSFSLTYETVPAWEIVFEDTMGTPIGLPIYLPREAHTPEFDSWNIKTTLYLANNPISSKEDCE